MSGPHRPGDVIGDRYEIQADVGEGGMQFVYAAYDRLIGRMVALKTPKNSSATKRFKRSAIVAAKVNHPNIAKTLDYVRGEGESRYLIEELIEGQDLQDALLRRSGCLDPFSAAKVFHYLAKGVAAAHHAGVVQAHVLVLVPALDDVAIDGREVDLAEAREVRVALAEHVEDRSALVGDAAERKDLHALDGPLAAQQACAVGERRRSRRGRRRK